MNGSQKTHTERLMVIAGLSATAMLVLAALAAVSMVLSKGDHVSEASLNVEVQGVPGYVYVGKPYTLTVDYANNGGTASGPVRVAIDMSGEHDFRVISASDNGEIAPNKVQWLVPQVAARSSGQLQFTVVAHSVKDYSKADYNFPGYAGHAAFEDGFHLAASIERYADDYQLASVAVVADTGAEGFRCARSVPTPCVEVVKINQGSSGESFRFQATNLPGSKNFSLSDGESEFIHYDACPNGGCANVLIRELDDSNLISINCQANDVAIDDSANPVSIRPDSFTGAQSVCFFINDVSAPPNVGGVFPAILGRPHATPTKQAAAAAGTLAPPRTGDAGLASEDTDVSAALVMLAGFSLAALAAVTSARKGPGRA